MPVVGFRLFHFSDQLILCGNSVGGGGGVLDDSWSVGRAEAFKQQQGGESFEETSRGSVRGEAPARKQIAGERSKRERERTHH